MRVRYAAIRQRGKIRHGGRRAPSPLDRPPRDAVAAAPRDRRLRRRRCIATTCRRSANRRDACRVTALVDPRAGRGGALRPTRSQSWSPGARAYDDLEAMLQRDGDLDAVIDLAPAPAHGAVNQADPRGRASTSTRRSRSPARVADADRLIETARSSACSVPVRAGRARRRAGSRWLRELVASGRYGPADARRRPPRRPGPGGLARVHRRPAARSIARASVRSSTTASTGCTR